MLLHDSGTDSAPDGIAIAANKLTLNGGTITATGSTTINANLDHAAVAIDAGQKVDGILPTLVTTGPMRRGRRPTARR